MERYLKPQIISDLKRKMVFLGGPRQVGKTTLALGILGKKKAGYLNWDTSSGRDKILRSDFPNTNMWVFDEIHKYKKWRNYLKGLFDEYRDSKRILVTGSARLDLYRRGGDSLQGRYHYLRLHPLSVAELKITTQTEFEALLKLSGFPEPFFSGSEKEARRWSREYRERFIQEDVKELEQVQDFASLELLMMRLPDLVGSPLSINGLREDLQLSHKTVSKWISIFERLYYIFRVLPFGSPGIKAVKKETKHYHFDWSLIKNPAFRFENMVACHLLKWVHYQIDTEGLDYELRYFRDRERDSREVDFIVCLDRKPIILIECKLNDSVISSSLQFMKRKFPGAEAIQLVAKSEIDTVDKNGIRLCSAKDYLINLI